MSFTSFIAHWGFSKINRNFIVKTSLAIVAKRFLKLPNLHTLIKLERITGFRDFWWIDNSVLNQGKSAIPPLFNGLELLSSASDRAKLFAINFSRNSNLDDSSIFLPVFPTRSNLQLHNIFVISEMVKKVTINPDLSNVFDPDCIPVVVLKNCESELSYIVAELFYMYLKESRLLKGLIGDPSI